MCSKPWYPRSFLIDFIFWSGVLENIIRCKECDPGHFPDGAIVQFESNDLVNFSVKYKFCIKPTVGGGKKYITNHKVNITFDHKVCTYYKIKSIANRTHKFKHHGFHIFVVELLQNLTIGHVYNMHKNLDYLTSQISKFNIDFPIYYVCSIITIYIVYTLADSYSPDYA